jgi:hypothetical protein
MPVSDIELTFEVSRRFRCTMRTDCGQIQPEAAIGPGPGEWHPHISERLDHEELADWWAGRDAVYQLAALTVDARLAVVAAASAQQSSASAGKYRCDATPSRSLMGNPSRRLIRPPVASAKSRG